MKDAELNYEKYAINRKPRKGRCKRSCFANGWHRVGTVPIASIIDGGMSGYSAKEICLSHKDGFNDGVESVAKEVSRNQGILHDIAVFIRSLKKGE